MSSKTPAWVFCGLFYCFRILRASSNGSWTLWNVTFLSFSIHKLSMLYSTKYLSVRSVHVIQQGKIPDHLEGGHRLHSIHRAKVEGNQKQTKWKTEKVRLEIHCSIWPYWLIGAPMNDSAKWLELELWWLAKANLKYCTFSWIDNNAMIMWCNVHLF